MIPTCNITLPFVRQSGLSIHLSIISALMHPPYTTFHPSKICLELPFNASNGQCEERVLVFFLTEGWRQRKQLVQADFIQH
ncbi:uncharacterized [Tachysurus ichikawai]